ncbi:MAG: caspase family protein [Bryobacteraceae bacterium]|nr:caspase family protein [Bryobacteraceae bacterium]
MRPLAFLLLGCGLLNAAEYAVLVGVSQYRIPGINLEGPAHDVDALRQLLLNRFGYSAQRIISLVNGQATRDGILQALSKAVAKLAAGDHLLFYFSGHGTSAFDQNMRKISPFIGPDSGALAPYDIALTDPAATAGSLIIGRRDLRPILSRVPAEARALVVIDACYSENAVKSVGVLAGAPVRGLTVEIPATETGRGPEPEPAGSYPYRNVVALAAASKNQPAIDINSRLLRNWRTVDGRPHGALTDSLLKALAGYGDTNRNGAISYDEMFQFVRRDMERYPHQPQLLSSGAFRLDQSVFAGAGAPAVSPEPEGADVRIRVKIESSNPAVQARLAAMPEIEIASRPYDILLRQTRSRWEIYDVSGVLMQPVPAQDIDLLVSRIHALGQISQLKRWSARRATYNVFLDVEPAASAGYDRLRSTFRVGELVRFRIRTERPAYLLLLGIDKKGRLSVLFPGHTAAEREPQPAQRPIEFVVKATPPAGAEQLKLIGFTERPPDWDNWVCASASSCPEFEPDAPRMAGLISMLRAARGTAEASLRVITQD